MMRLQKRYFVVAQSYKIIAWQAMTEALNLEVRQEP